MKYAILGLLGILLVGCSAPDTATKALKGAGYTDIKITGWSAFSCSKDDTFSTGFEAKGPTGVPVTGAVCSGLIFKNATIRTN